MSGGSRYSDALAGLGAILGIDRTGTRDEYLEDLRLAAALMRFDLEATRREQEQEMFGEGMDDLPDDEYDISDLLDDDDDW